METPINFKGTKGSWSVRKDGTNKHGVDLFDIDSDYGVEGLATVYAPFYVDGEYSEYEANAKAISAVPNMVNALLLVVNKPLHDWSLEDIEICKLALYKALGA